MNANTAILGSSQWLRQAAARVGCSVEAPSQHQVLNCFPSASHRIPFRSNFFSPLRFCIENELGRTQTQSLGDGVDGVQTGIP